MKPRKINLFIAVYALLVSFSACSNEDVPELNTSTGICLNIKTEVNTRSSVLPGTDLENKVEKLSIWLFSNDKDDDTTKKMYKSVSSSSQIVISEDDLKTNGMSPDSTYYVYVVANMPSGISLDGNSKLQDLKTSKFQASQRPGTSGENFYMSGYTKEAHDFGQTKVADIYLTRLASRLDITIKNETGDAWTVNKIYVKDDQKEVLWFASDVVQEAVLFDSPQDISLKNTSDNEQSYTAYVYENMSTTSMKIRVETTIGTEKFNWEAPITIDGKAKLERNTVGKATLKLKYSGVVIKCEVEGSASWNDNNIEESLDNLNMQFDKDLLILSDYGGGLLNVTTDAKEITVDASEAEGLIASGNVAVENGSCQLSLLLPNLMQEEYHGQLKVSAGTVSKTIQIMKPVSSFWFNFTADPKYPDGHSFPWYFTYDPATKTGTPFTFKFDMNIMAWVRYELYEMTPDGEVLRDQIDPGYDIQIPIGATTYELDMYGMIDKNYYDNDLKLVIYVGYLSPLYGPTAKILTYTINKNDGPDWTLPK